jgi:hypothetical protein
MKRVLVLIVAAVVGLALAGAVAPGVLWILPPEARSERIVWATTIVVVVLAVAAGWFVADPASRDRP